LTARSQVLPGAVAETSVVEAFAVAWAKRNPVRAELEHRHLLYQAAKAVAPSGVAGALVLAEAANTERHVAWETAFEVDVEAPAEHREHQFVLKRVRGWLAAGVLFDWMANNQAVAHGVVLPIGKDGARVLAIYTPPELRGRGYAQAMTAALTQRALDQGRWCTLFTDADNAITNKIYPRVGYRYVSEYTSYLFVPA
jgi:predicted GNAT family acetyltransferase